MVQFPNYSNFLLYKVSGFVQQHLNSAFQFDCISYSVLCHIFAHFFLQSRYISAKKCTHGSWKFLLLLPPLLDGRMQ